MINFDTIPGGGQLRVPFTYVEFNNTQAEGLPTDPLTALIIGQRTTGGTVAANVPTAITSGAQAALAFGADSMLAAMCDWFFSVNHSTPVVAIALDDDSQGVAATGTMTFAGTVSDDSTLHLYIAGIHVPVALAAGDTGSEVATKVQQALNLQLQAASNPRDGAPVGISTTNAVATFTAIHKGECGNDIDIRVNYYASDALPAGLTVAITPMSNGDNNPDISDMIAALGDVQYNVIVYPYSDPTNEDMLEAELVSRFRGIRQIEGVAWTAYRGTATDTDNFGQGRNCQLVTTLGTGIAPDPPYAWAAVAAGVCAPSLAADPARPLQTLQLTGLKAPAQADCFTWDERNLHLHCGIATYTVNRAGNVQIERMVTNYQTNAYDLADTSYLDIETLYTLGYLRFSTRTLITQKYPRYKLADDSVTPAPGQAIVTPRVINAELVSLAQDWVAAGLIEDLDTYKQSLVCQINATDPDRLDVLASPTLVGQFRIFAEQIQFLQNGAPAATATPSQGV